MDRGLNELLKWSIENASGAQGATRANDPAAAPPANRGLSAEALAALMGGPSDAELMRAAMAVITDRGAGSTTTLDERLAAFDDLEQLVESLDNANLLAPLGLWPALLGVLDSEEPALRRMAAWCAGTAVQNNQSSQEQLLAQGGVPPLVRMAASRAETAAGRRKAIYALSSACRNYQPAMDACLAALAALPPPPPPPPPADAADPAAAAAPAWPTGPVDAANMDAVDAVLNRLKADVQAAEKSGA